MKKLILIIILALMGCNPMDAAREIVEAIDPLPDTNHIRFKPDTVIQLSVFDSIKNN